MHAKAKTQARSGGGPSLGTGRKARRPLKADDCTEDVTADTIQELSVLWRHLRTHLRAAQSNLPIHGAELHLLIAI